MLVTSRKTISRTLSERIYACNVTQDNLADLLRGISTCNVMQDNLADLLRGISTCNVTQDDLADLLRGISTCNVTRDDLTDLLRGISTCNVPQELLHGKKPLRSNISFSSVSKTACCFEVAVKKS